MLRVKVKTYMQKFESMVSDEVSSTRSIKNKSRKISSYQQEEMFSLHVFKSSGKIRLLSVLVEPLSYDHDFIFAFNSFTPYMHRTNSTK